MRQRMKKLSWNHLTVKVLFTFAFLASLLPRISGVWDSKDICKDPIECNATDLIVSNPEDCSGYFICRGTSLIPALCPPNQTFDYIVVDCVYNNFHCQRPCEDPYYKTHIVLTTSSEAARTSQNGGSPFGSSTLNPTPSNNLQNPISPSNSGLKTMEVSSENPTRTSLQTSTVAPQWTRTATAEGTSGSRVGADVTSVTSTAMTSAANRRTLPLHIDSETRATSSNNRQSNTTVVAQTPASPTASRNLPSTQPSSMNSETTTVKRAPTTDNHNTNSATTSSRMAAFATTTTRSDTTSTTTSHRSYSSPEDSRSPVVPVITGQTTLLQVLTTTGDLTTAEFQNRNTGTSMPPSTASPKPETSETIGIIYNTVVGQPDSSDLPPIQTSQSQATASPQDMASPQDTMAPQDTVSPQDTASPQYTMTPHDTETPQDTASPQYTMTPHDTVSPQDTASPQYTMTSQRSTSDGVTDIRTDTSTVTPPNSVVTRPETVARHNTASTTLLVTSVNTRSSLDSSTVSSTSMTRATSTSPPIRTNTYRRPTTSEFGNTDAFVTSSSGDGGDRITTTPAPAPRVIDPCNPPWPCSIGEVFADPMDCRKFFLCIDAKDSVGLKDDDNFWMNVACSEDASSVFDSKTNRCTRPSIATCQPSCRSFITHIVTMFPRDLTVEGQPLIFACNFSITSTIYRAYVDSMNWYVNDLLVAPPGKNSIRGISIHEMKSDDLTGVWTSKLQFESTYRYSQHNGNVRCDVKYSHLFISQSRPIYFQVVPLPVVLLMPTRVTVFSGFNISLFCVKLQQSDVDVSEVTFEWFNGTNLIMSERGNVSKLSLPVSQSSEIICRGRGQYGVSGNQTAYVDVVPSDTLSDSAKLRCQNDLAGEWYWPEIPVNFIAEVPCRPPSTGLVTRKCVLQNSSADWLSPDLSNCLDAQLVSIWQQIENIENGIGADNSTLINNIINQLYNFTAEQSSNTSRLSSVNFNSSLNAIIEMTDIYSSNENSNFSDTDVNKIVETINIHLHPSYTEDWKLDGALPPSSVLKSVDDFGRQWAKKLPPGVIVQVAKSYMGVQVGTWQVNQTDSLSVPQKNSSDASDWIQSSIDNILVQRETLLMMKPADGSALLRFSSSYYRTLASFFKFNSSKNILDSRILSLTIDGVQTNHLDPKIRITFQNQNYSEGNFPNGLDRQCVFWNFSIQPNGNWSSNGCQRVPNASDSSVTTCECDHLTNFAILISPSSDTISAKDKIILSYISMVGCIISIVSLFLTIVLYATKWKKVKSHQAVVLINLCIALIIANVVFLSGSDRTNPLAGCQVVAVFLHYFFLTAFFLMLAEAFQLLMYTVFVFHVRRKRETAGVIVTAWVIPLIIVAITMGVSRMHGYGDSGLSCWLPPGKGIFWAFAGPALAIILVNFIIMVIVLSRVAHVRRPSEKEGIKEKMRATIWNVMVIAPVLGVAWVFGVFSVNNKLVAFQYIFAIFNSLQGLFIFIFHGLCNKRTVKDKYSVRGRSSKQNQASSVNTSREQRTAGRPPKHHSSRRKPNGHYVEQPSTQTTDDIVIMGASSEDMRTNKITVDVHAPHLRHEAEKISVSSGISVSSSSSYGETSDCYSYSTATTDVTSGAYDSESSRHLRPTANSSATSNL